VNNCVSPFHFSCAPSVKCERALFKLAPYISYANLTSVFVFATHNNCTRSNSRAEYLQETCLVAAYIQSSVLFCVLCWCVGGRADECGPPESALGTKARSANTHGSTKGPKKMERFQQIRRGLTRWCFWESLLSAAESELGFCSPI
jgi:hypothetical protein